VAQVAAPWFALAGRPAASALPLVRLAQDGDPLVQHTDLAGVMVDVVQHHLQDEGMVRGEERAVQGLPASVTRLLARPASRAIFSIAMPSTDSSETNVRRSSQGAGTCRTRPARTRPGTSS